MAGLKEVKKRIGSVRNIRKITKTMEMVSAAKSRKMMNRVHDSQPYGNKIFEIMKTISEMGVNIESPFLKSKENPTRYVLLVITANRGLCGAYNSNILRLSRQRIKELKDQDKEVKIYAIGKKAGTYFKFVKIPVEKVYTKFEDNFTYDDSKQLIHMFMDMFLRDEFDVLEVIYTHYYSATNQKAEIKQLLPIKSEQKSERKRISNIMLLPSKEVILNKMIPHILEYSIYKLILESVTSEQIYRRVAMKSASDAANDMTKILTRMYNRKRQGKITQEISEIIAGADAIK